MCFYFRNLQDDPDCQDLVPIDCETDDLYKCVKNGILIWYENSINSLYV